MSNSNEISKEIKRLGESLEAKDHNIEYGGRSFKLSYNKNIKKWTVVEILGNVEDFPKGIDLIYKTLGIKL